MMENEILNKALELAIAYSGDCEDDCPLIDFDIKPPWCDDADDGDVVVCQYLDKNEKFRNGGFRACWKRWFKSQAKIEFSKKNERE